MGAACPKILLTGRYAELAIDSQPAAPVGAIGERSACGSPASPSTGATSWLALGSSPGPGVRSPAAAGPTAAPVCRVPVDTSSGPVVTGTVRLESDAPLRVTSRSGTAVVSHEVGPAAAWYPVELADPPAVLVNNVGNELVHDTYGADRGWLDADDGEYDDPVDVFAWCGGAVLLRGEYLDDVGIFDERLFLYCEDLELSWRGRDRGWRYRTVPSSVVDHEHAATAVEGSALSDYYNQRNHLLVVTRHAEAGVVARVWFRYLAVTASYLRRDVLSHWMGGRKGSSELVGRRLAAFAGALRRAPVMLGARRRDARRSRRAD